MEKSKNVFLDQGASAFMAAAVVLLTAGEQPFYIPLAFAAMALVVSYAKYKLRG